MSTKTDFANRTVLITGAASGIGAACARHLAANGAARLVLVDRDEGRLKALDLACQIECHVGDVSDPDFWARLDCGSLDHAIINAGIASGAPIAEMTFEHWRQIMSVNLDGAFLTLQKAMKAMKNGGSIVLLSSVSGIKASPGTAAYGASKAALIQLSKIAALEGAPGNIRVNAIAPGGVDTAIWDSMPEFAALEAEKGREAAIAVMASATPSGRFASADEIANSIAFLLCDAAANITGTVLSSDGGFSL